MILFAAGLFIGFWCGIVATFWFIAKLGDDYDKARGSEEYKARAAMYREKARQAIREAK